MNNFDFSSFYLFENNGKKYLYDSVLNSVFEINQSIYENFLKKEVRLKKYPFQVRKTVRYFLSKRDMHVEPSIDENANVMISLSNICNMNCDYCFKEKYPIKKMEQGTIREILDFVKKKYKPNAKQYIFSLSLTSESFCDFELLEFFDKVISEKEGFLFEYEDFINISPRQLFDYLPNEIKEKYLYETKKNTYIDILNMILQNEELYKYISFNNFFVKDIISYSDDLSISRRTVCNRLILNELYSKSLKNRDIPWISMAFMTNATLINQKFVNFIKSINLRSICVSIDGDESLNDFSRKMINGNGSYNLITKGISLLLENGVSVIGSIVFGVHNANPLMVFDHLLSLGIKKFTYNIVRNKNKDSFDEQTIRIFLKNFQLLYHRMINDLKNNDIRLVSALKETFALEVVNAIIKHKYRTSRCNYSNQISFDTDGNIYHCVYLNGIEKRRVGNCFAKEFHPEEIRTVEESTICGKCWARYLCGGTCYAEMNLNSSEINPVECIYRKEMIKMQIEFYVLLKNEKLLSCYNGIV